MKRKEVMALVEAMTDGIWNRHQYELGAEIFSADFVDHDPMPGQGRGFDGYIDIVRWLCGMCPDMRITNDAVYYDAKQSIVTIRWRGQGTGRNSLLGLVLGSKPINMKGIDVFKVQGGRFTEHWGEIDAAAFLKV